MLNLAVFGLGEAGALISADLAAAGAKVRAYDPADVVTPAGVERVNEPVQAVAQVDAVLAITPGADAMEALEQALAEYPEGALYADFSTNSASAKSDMGAVAAGRKLAFVDVALMTVVPGNGLKTPTLVSGAGAKRWAELAATLGMPAQVVSEVPGDAAVRKLLRSIMMKGLAGVVIEAMRAGEAAGCADWLWNNLAAQITAADETLLRRLVTGTGPHAGRRVHEMQCAAALLAELGVESTMTGATVASLKQVVEQGLPPGLKG